MRKNLITPSPTKRIIIAVIAFNTFVLLSFLSNAQSGQKWASNGNLLSKDEFIGSSNNFPILFKTNNALKMSLGTNGLLNLKTLAGTGNRLMQTDTAGNLLPFAMGTASQVLYGNGIWGALPTTGLWQSNGNNLYWNNGYVGIGTQYPVFQLDVQGDARITNNLYVGGGIVISEKMRANVDIETKEMRAVALSADSIKMDATKAFYGETNVRGDLKAKYNFQVDGSAAFNGSLTAGQGLMLNNTLGMKLLNGGSNGTTPSITFGQVGPPNTTLPINECLFPSQSPWFYFGGRIQLYDNTSNVALTMGSDGAQSVIESSGSNHLLLNYYCGKDIAICTGQNGGTVTMGKTVSMAQNLGIGNAWPNPTNTDANVALNIFGNATNMTALKLNVWEGTVKAIDLVNPANGFSSFSLLKDGTLTSASLSGTGTRTLLVDAAGKLIPGTASTQSTVNWAVGGNTINNPATEYLGTSSNSDLVFATNAIAKMTIKADGNVGINNASPYKMLTVNGDVSFANYAPPGSNPTNGFNGLEIVGNDQVPARRGISLEADPNGDFDFFINNNQSNGSASFYFKNGAMPPSYNNATSATAANNLMSISGDGRLDVFGKTTNALFTLHNTNITTGNDKVFEVGADGKTCINCDNPGTFMLAVNGKLGAREIKVTMVNPWPDYVFEKNYQLPTLQEIEKYVNANKHLPEVPSETELKKEEYSLDIAQMQAIQLKKTEEIFLYLIQLQKQIDELKKENSDLKTKIK